MKAYFLKFCLVFLGIALINIGTVEAGSVSIVHPGTVTNIVVVSSDVQTPLIAVGAKSLTTRPGSLGLQPENLEDIGIYLPDRQTGGSEDLWIGLRSLVEEGRQDVNDNRGWTPFGDVSDLYLGGGLVSAAVLFDHVRLN